VRPSSGVEDLYFLQADFLGPESGEYKALCGPRDNPVVQALVSRNMFRLIHFYFDLIS
jgi:hypothetical protein